MDSFDLQVELQSLQDVSHMSIPNEHDIPSMDARSISQLLERIVEALADSSDTITDPEIFDAYRSLLRYAEFLQGATMSKIIDSISSAFQSQIMSALNDLENEEQQVYVAHRLPLELYAFLFHWFVIAAEKVKTSGEEDVPAAPPARPRRGRGGKAASSRAVATAKKVEGWTWVDQIPNTLTVISKALRIKTQRIWATTADRDAFIKYVFSILFNSPLVHLEGYTSCLTRPAYHLTESEQYMKHQAIRLGIYKIICLAVKHHSHSLVAQITIMQSLQYHEHLSEPMAECLTILAKEFDHSQLGDEVLREIAGKTFNPQDSKSPRAFSRFLVRFTELAPRAVLKQISLLLAHLDSEVSVSSMHRLCPFCLTNLSTPIVISHADGLD